jgi:hypothetical protein
MPQEGPSEVLANKILNAIYNNIPLAFGLTTAQLHIGPPGADFTAHVYEGATRQAMTCGTAADAATSATGLPSFGPMTEATPPNQPVSHVSLHSGYEGDPDAIPLQSGRLLVPQDFAEGDIFDLASAKIEWDPSGLASD